MDLRSFKLRLAARHVRAVVAGAGGETGKDLFGEQFSRIATAAATLVAAVEARGHGRARALSVDFVAHVLRASLDGASAGPGLVIDGAALDALGEAIKATSRAIGLELRPVPRATAGSPSEASFWNSLYLGGRDAWELARAAPPIERWFSSHSPAGKRALVVGCGRGHEARILAFAGATVTAIDFAPQAITEARALATAAGLTIDFRQRDLFRLPEEADRYDLIVEHTCFCAIDPARRAEYVEVMAALLVEGGELVGLFWSHGRPGGPPFTTTLAELRTLFSPRFEVLDEHLATDSVALRAGQELLIRFRRRDF